MKRNIFHHYISRQALHNPLLNDWTEIWTQRRSGMAYYCETPLVGDRDNDEMLLAA